MNRRKAVFAESRRKRFELVQSYLAGRVFPTPQRKSESRAPFQMALDLLDLPSSQALVVEDMADNLRIPYEMGLATVLVHYGRPPEPMPGHVQIDCNNAAEFLRLMEDYKASG